MSVSLNVRVLVRCVAGLAALAWGCAAWAECNALLKPSYDRTKFVVEPTGVVVDLTTGLMWRRCPMGYEWKNSACALPAGAVTVFSWAQALEQAAKAKNFAGFSDWRMPNKNELGSIVDYACAQPALDNTLFPETAPSGYWTNSPNSFTPERAWAVNFAYGDHMSSMRTDLLGVRLVREIPR